MLKCIIVDDEPLAQEVLENYLQRIGGEIQLVKKCSNALDAFQALHDERIDLLFLDIQMPVKGGFEVLKELHDDKELMRIPVIILSNVDDEEAFRKAGKFETRFYLIKSLVTPQKVVDTVREALRLSL